MIIGSKEFNENKTHIMGILNVTPDSFSDGGSYTTLDRALFRVDEMMGEGADIIDVGGESARPGYTMVSDEEEISRVVPVIRAIKERFDIPVSVDTYKGAVARAALDAGADMLNDIWGLKHDPVCAETAAEHNAAVCLMHNRKDAAYGDFLADVFEDLRGSISIAKSAGIEDGRIILDPGVGFAKTYEQNLYITKNLGRLKELGYPVLLGASRKSMIGLALDLPKDERLEGTVTTSVIACMQGAMFVRVHDVRANARAVRMAEAVVNARL